MRSDIADTNKRKSKKHGIDGVVAQTIVILFVFVSIVITFFPLVITIFNSLKNDYEIMTSILAPPKDFVFSNFGMGFDVIIGNMFNSIVVAFVAAFANTFLGLILAYVFVRKEFFLKGALFNFYIFVLMIPSIIGMPILYSFMTKLNLLNTWAGILLPVIGGGQVGSLFLFRTFLTQQPASLYEAAKIDGANDLQIFFGLCIPLSVPIIMFSLVGLFASNYNDFLWPGLVITEDKISTLMPILKRIVTQYETRNMGVSYAIYLVSGIPLIFTSIIGLKYFSNGDFAAGLKL